MDLIKIYQSEDCSVIAYKWVLNYLEHIINTEFRLDDIQAEQVLMNILKDICNDFDLYQKKIITTSKIPILSRGSIFDLVEPYQGLEDAVLLLSDAFDQTEGKLTKEWKKYLSNYIKAHYFLTFHKNCDIIFFVETIYKVSCAIVLLDGENLYILPISLNENDFYQKLY